MRIACLLLAAGSSSRFGGCKQLAPLNGKPLVVHALEALLPLFDGSLFIVLGASRDQIRPLVASRSQVIEHRHWRKGIGSSIALGVTAIEARLDYDAILVALADQARLGSDDYRRLIERFDGERIVAAGYAGRAGVPAIFPASRFATLCRLDGDRGARPLLDAMGAQIVSVPMPAAADDIDTIEDLRRLAPAGCASRL